MANPLTTVATLQLELVLHGLALTKQLLEIGLRFQPQPARLTGPAAAVLPTLTRQRRPRRLPSTAT